MEVLTVRQQAARMRAVWPRFGLIVIGDWGACWEGPVVSWEKEYNIRIWYVPRGEIGGCLVPTWQPDVYVVGEKLRYFHWESGQVLPHFNMRLGPPSICCYDIAKGDWDPSRAIADTIVFYASNWLRFYELWCVTGEWTGPESARATMDMFFEEKPTSRTRLNRDRREPDDRHGRKFRGLKTATSTSFALMAAASKGSFPPLSWRDWSGGFQREPTLPIISTSWPALPLAA